MIGQIGVNASMIRAPRAFASHLASNSRTESATGSLASARLRASFSHSYRSSGLAINRRHVCSHCRSPGRRSEDLPAFERNPAVCPHCGYMGLAGAPPSEPQSRARLKGVSADQVRDRHTPAIEQVSRTHPLHGPDDKISKAQAQRTAGHTRPGAHKSRGLPEAGHASCAVSYDSCGLWHGPAFHALGGMRLPQAGGTVWCCASMGRDLTSRAGLRPRTPGGRSP
jgi:hypothetical protein